MCTAAGVSNRSFGVSRAGLHQLHCDHHVSSPQDHIIKTKMGLKALVSSSTLVCLKWGSFSAFCNPPQGGPALRSWQCTANGTVGSSCNVLAGFVRPSSSS